MLPAGPVIDDLVCTPFSELPSVPRRNADSILPGRWAGDVAKRRFDVAARHLAPANLSLGRAVASEAASPVAIYLMPYHMRFEAFVSRFGNHRVRGRGARMAAFVERPAHNIYDLEYDRLSARQTQP